MVEYKQYQESLNAYRDIKNSVDTAFEEGEIKGKIKGKIEGKIEIAKGMKNDGMSIELIMKYTGLSKAEIKKL